MLRFALLAWLAAGCATQAPPPAAPASPPPAFRFSAGDMVQIRIWPDSAVGGSYPIEPDGIVQLPLVGSLHAEGMTREALQDSLHVLYGDVWKNPVVVVIPRFQVTVVGAVGHAGLFEMTPQNTLLDVVAMAGGFVAKADPARAELLRGGRRVPVNLASLMDASGSVAPVGLRSGDVLYVPEKGFKLQARDVLIVLQSVALILTLIKR